MRALVAGGAGFIGSHVVEALLDQGAKVVCIDNLSLGHRENLAHLAKADALDFLEMDILDKNALHTVFRSERFDCVFHMAANSDIQASGENPEIEYRNTYSTTFHLLEAMRAFKVSKLFFASTSAVYGDRGGMAASETNTALIPISYYGAAKLGAESLIQAFSHMNQMDALIFRFPNVVGPRLTHGVIYDFISRLKADPSQLTILGDGNQTKPYMDVSDLIKGLFHLLDSAQGVSVYNIGVETQTSVRRIGEIVLTRMGLSGIPVYYTGGKGGWRGDVPRFAYDLSKIHRTGWRAALTSDEAVERAAKEALK